MITPEPRRLGFEDAMRPPADRPRIGLALGSGIARGWAHIGVLRALLRYGIVPDVVAGCSIGAVVGGAWLAGHLDTLEDWARGLNRAKLLSYVDFRASGGGLIRGRKLLDVMNAYMGDLRVESLDRPFAAVATDLTTGHEAWLRDGMLTEAIRASFSIPGVFPPHKVGNRFLVDGALVNPVPVSVCHALGAQMTIAVNLSADMLGKVRRQGHNVSTVMGFDVLPMLEQEASKHMAEEQAASSRWKSTLNMINPLTWGAFRRDPGYPSLFGVMVSTLNIVQDRITRSRLAGDPPDVQIAPKVGHIGVMEFDRAGEAIAEGEAAVERSLPELREAMNVLRVTPETLNSQKDRF